jgi:4-alpha-glucanotransferase
LLAHVDVIRLDHFLAFVAAWHVPASAPTAQTGEWVRGPGAEFFNAVQSELDGLPFIAEDLGVITPEVSALRDRFHIPGTRVLQFAFDGRSDNPHLPHNYVPNMVVYTGTHDNDTAQGWFESLSDRQRHDLLSHVENANSEVGWELIRLAWSSPAALAIAPLQDLLNFGCDARMNVPGKAHNNWAWRCTEDMLAEKAFRWLRELTATTHRSREFQGVARDMVRKAAS